MHPLTVSERENTDRIIPFGYPTIPGGASGGASVDPTPPSSDDPQPGPASLPYNLDNLSIAPKGIVDNCDTVANVSIAKTATADVRIWNYVIAKGIVPVDLTGVKQITMVCPSYSSDSFVFTADGVSVKDKFTGGFYINATKTILTFQDDDNMYASNDGYLITKSNWNTYISGKQIVFSCPMEVTVYDTAGEIMQQVTVEVKL